MSRVASRVLVLVTLLALTGLVASCSDDEASQEPEQADQPSSGARAGSAQDEATEETTAREATREATEAEEVDEESAEAEAYQYEDQYDAEQYEEDAPAPADSTMYLTIPKLGISGTTVAEGEAGLEIGAMHLAGTGYPWQQGANTYIAGHRVGFPGTGSDRIFYDLPLMAEGDEVVLEDSNGEVYNYRVSEVFAVTPYDLWVTEPTGSDVVTLQVCTESPDDWFTIGPQLMESGPESGRLIVRAERV